MFKGFADITREDYFTVDRSNRSRRYNNFMSRDQIFSSHEAKYFFNLVNVYNSLPHAVDNITVSDFKNKLDKYLQSSQEDITHCANNVKFFRALVSTSFISPGQWQQEWCGSSFLFHT